MEASYKTIPLRDSLLHNKNRILYPLAEVNVSVVGNPLPTVTMSVGDLNVISNILVTVSVFVDPVFQVCVCLSDLVTRGVSSAFGCQGSPTNNMDKRWKVRLLTPCITVRQRDMYQGIWVSRLDQKGEVGGRFFGNSGTHMSSCFVCYDNLVNYKLFLSNSNIRLILAET